MDLWSKGLGRRVLNLRLCEREEMVERQGRLDIKGVMGPPVFWNYRVTLGERDVLDFLDFLRKPIPVQYLVAAEKRSTILATALAGALIFLRRTLFLMLGGKPAAATDQDTPAQEREREAHGELGS